MKNVCKLSPKQKEKEKILKLNALYTGSVVGGGGGKREEVALNLSKTCRLLGISVYARRGERRFQRMPP